MTHQPHQRQVYAGGLMTTGPRELPAEVAVALSFNGTTQAVMMATPADLTDFALGFAVSEGIANTDEITSIEVAYTAQGIDVQTWLKPEAEARLAARRRTMAGPVGCGLCGVDSIAEALRDVPKVTADLHLTPAQICEAVAALPAYQALHDTTRAAHAAAFWTPARGITLAREDVGRHNALDKLIGALTTTPQGAGAVVMTSRVSIDLIQKIAMLGAPVLIAVSAPTAQAVELADAAGITLIALARPDRFECFTHPHRITNRKTAYVA
ncbi:MAG: formate dehydrogenase accessory sulfurtransferase FdhD [Rhodobacteraceae bacterium]|nr:formate dehydrogenase accessory sulfurtransferase FdhD [Paracoccaceae bacterium]